MLSATARPYIEASVPVLREHGLAITRAFYRNMFAAHPELTEIFNMGNQASGVQQQSLAAAVFAYAANIDNAAALGPVVNRIVHKHASVGIKPAHYPIVGRHLLGAIKEVLGEAATTELIAAWDEAYWLLAGELIAAEARLYQRTGVAPGELQAVRVTERREEGAEVVSFTLAHPDGSPLPAFKPGQYISVEVKLPEGQRQLRQYSLSDAAGLPTWRISVKREAAQDGAPAGAVSNWLHDRVRVGDLLSVSKPFGDFTPAVDGDEPLVLLSAGVGVTPMTSVLNTLLKQNPKRRVMYAHAARHGGVHAHKRDVLNAREHMRNLAVEVWYEHPRTQDREGIDYSRRGRMALTKELLAPYGDATYCLCGPVGFMQEQWRSLIALGVPVERIEREVFGPDLLDHLL